MIVGDCGAGFFKRRLLGSVSTLALLVVIGGTDGAEAADWFPGRWNLEIGGAYDLDASGASQSFTASPGIPDPTIRPRHGYDGIGKLTYQAPDSPFSYALGVRYGRSRSASRDFSDIHPTLHGSFNQSVDESDRVNHTVVDFEVGKDIGLGLFGSGVTTVGGGLRYAHFDDKTRGSFSTSSKYTTRAGRFDLSRRSDVVGPRIFAKTTSPFSGELGQRGLSLGLSAGAGILFGRETTKNDVTLSSGSSGPFTPFSRSRQITVPTLDASAQLNWSVPGSPLMVSAGYRYDGAYRVLDGGFSGSSQINSVQHGPFLALVWTID